MQQSLLPLSLELCAIRGSPRGEKTLVTLFWVSEECP